MWVEPGGRAVPRGGDWGCCDRGFRSRYVVPDWGILVSVSASTQLRWSLTKYGVGEGSYRGRVNVRHVTRPEYEGPLPRADKVRRECEWECECECE